MFVRIVKLSFQPEKVDEFLANFDKIKHKVRGFDGCNHLELLRDKHTENIFFTYSYWKSEQHLENYRNSEFFKGIWAQTKALFNDKPEAWSVDRLTIVDL